MAGRVESTLAVFAKHWTPGRTKTRLAASIGEEYAASLSRAFLVATLANLEGIASDLQLLYTPVEEAPAFERLIEQSAPIWTASPQPGGDLGARMRRVLSDTNQPTIIVGSDSPDLPREALAEAFQWLNDGDNRFVLGPSDDGGYWAIGCRGAPPEVFDDMPWGTDQVYSTTIDRLEQSGQRQGVDYLVLPRWYDIDTETDLRSLYTRLRERKRQAIWLENLQAAISRHCV